MKNGNKTMYSLPSALAAASRTSMEVSQDRNTLKTCENPHPDAPKMVAKSIFFTRTIVAFCITYDLLSFVGFFLPARRPSYQCNDPSLNKPFNGDTVHAGLLFVLIIFGPTIVFSAIERHRRNHLGVPSKLRQRVRHYLAGLLYVGTITEMLKNYFSELRPHFLQTCVPRAVGDDPTIASTNFCSGVSMVEDYVCTGDGPYWLVQVDVFKSFPSGHASTSVYAFVYLTLYVFYRGSDVWHWLHKWATVLVLAVLAALCGMSRIVDCRHFWWDVAAGSFLGLVGGSLTMAWNVGCTKAVLSGTR